MAAAYFGRDNHGSESEFCFPGMADMLSIQFAHV